MDHVLHQPLVELTDHLLGDSVNRVRFADTLEFNTPIVDLCLCFSEKDEQWNECCEEFISALQARITSRDDELDLHLDETRTLAERLGDEEKEEEGAQ